MLVAVKTTVTATLAADAGRVLHTVLAAHGQGNRGAGFLEANVHLGLPQEALRPGQKQDGSTSPSDVHLDDSTNSTNVCQQILQDQANVK
jgi:hypothetical protein